MSAEARLSELGLVLPGPAAPAANYVTFVRTGDLVFTSGHGPANPAGGFTLGRVPDEVSVDDAYVAARHTALSLIATLRANLGSLDRVVRIVKVLGLVYATAEFADHPRVINGCSDLLVEVFGERGVHARSAFGVVSLPFRTTVEIELIAEVTDSVG